MDPTVDVVLDSDEEVSCEFGDNTDAAESCLGAAMSALKADDEEEQNISLLHAASQDDEVPLDHVGNAAGDDRVSPEESVVAIGQKPVDDDSPMGFAHVLHWQGQEGYLGEALAA